MNQSQFSLSLTALACLFVLLTHDVRAVGPVLDAEKEDSLTDANSDLRANPGETLKYTVRVTGSSGDVTNLNLQDVLDPRTVVNGLVKSKPLAFDDSFSTLGNITIVIPAAGLLANDVDAENIIKVDGAFQHLPAGLPENTGLNTMPEAAKPTTLGGTVTITAAAATYNPPPGAAPGSADSFTYTVVDGDGNTDTGNVSVTINGPTTWFVDASVGASGNGTQALPFDSLSDIPAAGIGMDGDLIFVAFNPAAYDGGVQLKANQKLIGQGSDLATAGALTVPAGATLPGVGSLPTITNVAPAANGVSLAAGNTVAGLDIGDTGGTGLAGSSVGTLTVSNVGISGTGGGIDIATGALDVMLNSLSASSATDEGIRLSNVTGSFTVNGSGNVIDTSTGTSRGVDIDGGPGDLTLDVTLQGVSTSGADRGISLIDTTGTFTVTGNGDISLGGNASGGTISGGAIGVFLSNADGVSLTNLDCTGTFTDYAIRGTDVIGFNYNNGTISGTSGDNAAADEGAVRFTNLSAASTINGSDISGGFEDNVTVDNNTGTLTLTIDGSRFTGNPGPQQNDGVSIEGTGSSIVNVTVLNTTFVQHRGDHFQVNLVDNCDSTVVFGTAGQGNTLTGGHPFELGGGISLTGGNTGNTSSLVYAVEANTITEAFLQAVNVNIGRNGVGPGGGPASDQAQWKGTITGNDIGSPGILNSGTQTSNAIEVTVTDAAKMTSHIDDNNILEWAQTGITVRAVDAAASNLGGDTVHNTITNNLIDKSVDDGLFFTFAGIDCQSGASSTFPDDHDLDSHIAGNTVSGPASVFAVAGIQVNERFSTVHELSQHTSASTDSETVLRDNNTINNANSAFSVDVDDVNNNVSVNTGALPPLP